MSLLSIKSRLKAIEDKVFFEDKDKWRLNIIDIFYKGTDEDINNNKKYHLNYNNKELVYDNIDDFYNEYKVYPKKDINPVIIEIIDNSHLERYMYMEN
jgi:hypothetical protein